MTKILLADDARLVPDVERSFLERAGCEIVTAATGPEAVEKAKALRPDLVLLDADLPALDGPACCRALRADPGLADTPILFVTSPFDEERWKEGGADGFVPKPLTRNRLLETVRRFARVEERGSERAVVALRVGYVQGSRQGVGYARDLATNGLFLKTHETLRIGDRVDLSFVLPIPGAPEIRAVAEVVRVLLDDPGAHQAAGVAVRFREMSAGHRLEVSRYLREHGGEAP